MGENWKKKQRETGRYKNNRQKLARINKNWQNGQSHANVQKFAKKVSEANTGGRNQHNQEIS